MHEFGPGVSVSAYLTDDPAGGTIIYQNDGIKKRKHTKDSD